MVVAAGAADGQAEEGLAGGPQNVVEIIVASQLAIRRFVVPNAKPIKAGGRDAVGVAIRKLVASQLLHDETVVRLVLVEGANDVVAVFPHQILPAVPLVPVCLGKANKVEPMPPPLFAIPIRGQQLVDDFLERARRRVGEKRLDLRRRRRQAGQVVASPANQHTLGRRGAWPQTDLVQPIVNERIDAVLLPSGVIDLRRGSRLDRLERPGGRGALVDLVRRQVAVSKLFAMNLAGGIKRSAQFHPLGQQGDLLIRQFLLRRHLVVFVLPRDHRQQQALLRLGQVDRRAGLAALEQALPVGEAKVALEFLPRPVALETLRLEDGENLVVKKLNLGRVRQLRGRTPNTQSQATQSQNCFGAKLF